MPTTRSPAEGPMHFSWFEYPRFDEYAAGAPRTLQAVLDRYARFPGILGFEKFSAAIHSLIEISHAYEFDGNAAQEILDRFLQQTSDLFYTPSARIKSASQSPRVFISHRQRPADIRCALRMTCLALKRGFDYWLDLHSPALQSMASTTLPTPVKSVATALIIELALMNCSHVLAVVTTNTAGSLWVPYEYGRAKARHIVSSQSAAWLAPRILSRHFGEYLWLGEILHSETQIDAWFSREAHKLFGVVPHHGVPWAHAALPGAGPRPALPGTQRSTGKDFGR